MFTEFSGKLRARLALIFVIVLTASCSSNAADTSGTAPPPLVRWWETSVPDFSSNPDRPLISVIGSNAIHLNVGDTYVDEGATADDLQDGDLTLQISVENPVDTSAESDYLVRYTVTDSSGLDAIEALRIVRVHDNVPKRLSARIVGSTASHLGYIEHLPNSYTDNPGQMFPLLIFNHGSGANATPLGESGDSPLDALGVVLRNAGPALIINGDNWIESDPLIVLSPQMIAFDFDDPIARIDAFVDFAVATYNVDPSRVYMSGWSAGASLSLAHAVMHPEKLAALVPISGGLRLTDETIFPNGFCDVEQVPVWAFHGDNDATTSVDISIDNHQSVINNCLSPVPPRLTVYQEQTHFIHHATYNLTMMEGGNLGVSGDSTYDLYEQSIFDWLLSHTLDNRVMP